MNASDLIVYAAGVAAFFYVLRYALKRLLPGWRLLRSPARHRERGCGNCDGCG